MEYTYHRLVVLTALSLVLTSACTPRPGGADGRPHQERGADETGVAYVDDTACTACHQQASDAWTGSHHDLAMQVATPETVLGDFGDATFSHLGSNSRFFQRDGRFFVNTEGPDGELADFELTHTFGVEPLQQYLAPFPGGRLQSLTIAWDTERDEWFHLYPNERIEPDDPLHWTGRYQNWNLMCASCHSTDLRKNYDVAGDAYETTWAEIDVGCQACHGPGGNHLELARAAADGGTTPDEWGLVAPFSVDDPTPEVDTCAPCHSRREPLTPVAAHGGALLDDYLPARLREGLYHPDGQILDEVYVYGSFVQSKMHAAGVRCSNCHDPHRLSLLAEGNTLCTRCHRDAARGASEDPLEPRVVERFPMLEPGSYDTAEHHHHEAGSAGAACVNCHMPAQTYMVVDPRRDHSFRVPRPDLSATLGTPNACTGCHEDRNDAWAADAVADWTGTVPAPHFGETLAAGRSGDRSAQGDLVALAGDPAHPAIVRATALELLRGFGQTGLSAARGALSDDDPLVRVAAAGGLEALAPQARRAALQPLVTDPVRAVRIEAARLLAEAWADYPSADPALATAAAEYLSAQTAVADMPAGHLGLGVVHQRQGAPERAEAEYRAALTLDPWFTPARFNLANLLNTQARNAEAETVLRRGLDYTPDEGELHYSLGLLLAEENRLDESVASLGRAAELTGRARIRYNHGLALQQVGRLDEAEAALREARSLDDSDPDVLLALARLLMDQQRWEEARTVATELVRLVPTAPGPQRLLNELQVLERRSRR
jgi:predicted CXXCH cytochrome family protein